VSFAPEMSPAGHLLDEWPSGVAWGRRVRRQASLELWDGFVIHPACHALLIKRGLTAHQVVAPRGLGVGGCQEALGTGGTSVLSVGVRWARPRQRDCAGFAEDGHVGLFCCSSVCSLVDKKGCTRPAFRAASDGVRQAGVCPPNRGPVLAGDVVGPRRDQSCQGAGEPSGMYSALASNHSGSAGEPLHAGLFGPATAATLRAAAG
jgi:hypothetical protein